MEDYLASICYDLLKGTFIEHTKKVLQYAYQYMREHPEKVDQNMLRTLLTTFKEIEALQILQKESFNTVFNQSPKSPGMGVSWKSSQEKNSNFNSNDHFQDSSLNYPDIDVSALKASRTIDLSQTQDSEMSGAYGGVNRSQKYKNNESRTSRKNNSELNENDSRYTIKRRVHLKMPDGTKKSTTTTLTGPKKDETWGALTDDLE